MKHAPGLASVDHGSRPRERVDQSRDLSHRNVRALGDLVGSAAAVAEPEDPQRGVRITLDRDLPASEVEHERGAIVRPEGHPMGEREQWAILDSNQGPRPYQRRALTG